MNYPMPGIAAEKKGRTQQTDPAGHLGRPLCRPAHRRLVPDGAATASSTTTAAVAAGETLSCAHPNGARRRLDEYVSVEVPPALTNGVVLTGSLEELTLEIDHSATEAPSGRNARRAPHDAERQRIRANGTSGGFPGGDPRHARSDPLVVRRRDQFPALNKTATGPNRALARAVADRELAPNAALGREWRVPEASWKALYRRSHRDHDCNPVRRFGLGDVESAIVLETARADVSSAILPKLSMNGPPRVSSTSARGPQAALASEGAGASCS